MALPVNSLGSFTFRFWLGDPPGSIGQNVEVLSHPGVDYEVYRWTGLRSGNFQRTSIVDVADIASGRTTFNQYTAAIQTGPHKLVWFDYDFDTELKRAVVQSVNLVGLRKRVQICYEGSTGNTWDLIAQWNLFLTPWS